MGKGRFAFILTVILGVISLGCTVLIRLALNNIWSGVEQTSGSIANLSDWKVIGGAFWVVAVFHAVFIVVATYMLVNPKPSK